MHPERPHEHGVVTELMLGTAQFGAGYGITNSAGRLDDATVARILATSATSGIDLFDTAPDYGDAQARIGRLRQPGPTPRYVSKFGIPDSDAPIDFDALFEGSLEALGAPTLYGLLFHRVSDLRDPRAVEVWKVLRRARACGRVTRIGASIYDRDDLAVVIERFPDLDLIQIPGNIVDRRLLDDADLHALHERGVEIHVRSAYLQGLLLAAPEDVPKHLEGLKPAVVALRAIARREGRSVLDLALGFLKTHEVVDAVLVGALAPEELRATIAAWQGTSGTSSDAEIPLLDASLLDPRQWPTRIPS